MMTFYTIMIVATVGVVAYLALKAVDELVAWYKTRK